MKTSSENATRQRASSTESLTRAIIGSLHPNMTCRVCARHALGGRGVSMIVERAICRRLRSKQFWPRLRTRHYPPFRLLRAADQEESNRRRDFSLPLPPPHSGVVISRLLMGLKKIC